MKQGIALLTLLLLAWFAVPAYAEDEEVWDESPCANFGDGYVYMYDTGECKFLCPNGSYAPDEPQCSETIYCMDGTEATYDEYGNIQCSTDIGGQTCPTGQWYIEGSCRDIDTDTNNTGCPYPAQWKLSGTKYTCQYPEGTGSEYCGQEMKNCDWLTHQQGEDIKSTLGNISANTASATITFQDMLGNQQTISAQTKSSKELLGKIEEKLGTNNEKVNEITDLLTGISYKTKDYTVYHQEQQQHNQTDLITQNDIKLGLDGIKGALDAGIKTADTALKDSVDNVKTATDGVKTALETASNSLGQTTQATNDTKASVDNVKTSTDAVKTSVDKVKESTDAVTDAIKDLTEEVKKLSDNNNEEEETQDPPDLELPADNPIDNKMQGDPKQQFTDLLTSIKQQFAFALPTFTAPECGLLPVISVSVGNMTLELDFTQEGFCTIFALLANFLNVFIALQAALIVFSRGS